MTKVAIVQEPPVYLNIAATMDRVLELQEGRLHQLPNSARARPAGAQSA